jgi:uncharacterized protein YdeI (YjbR/CyaY-like superfamily)
MAPIFFESPAALRKWLEKNHAREIELFVGLHKRHTGKRSITWAEVVDQALCYGWIDGVRRTLDDDAWMIRLTPRGARSNWSTVNVKRAGELAVLGLMTPAGLTAFKDRPASGPYSYEQERREFEGAYLRRLKANRKAWEFYRAQPPGYRAVACHWVMSAKKVETRMARLDRLIADSANGVRTGAVTYTRKTSARMGITKQGGIGT